MKSTKCPAKENWNAQQRKKEARKAKKEGRKESEK